MSGFSAIFVSSEVYPFSKTGGLADVSSSLPKALKKVGLEDIIIATPFYSKFIDSSKYPVKSLGLIIPIYLAGDYKIAEVFEIDWEGVKIYFIKNDEYFGRDFLYGTPEGDYPDNAYRFAFFSYAVLELLSHLDLKPNIIHVNDWQTSLIPVLLYSGKRGENLRHTKTILTIHNIAYQGIFEPEILPKIGLGFHLFHMEALEFYGKINFLKGGIVFSDWVTTVSPTYKEEITTPELGSGLDGIIRRHIHKFSGILNGIDYFQWDPQIDSEIYQTYSKETVDEGKRINKLGLLRELGFSEGQFQLPLFGVVSRLAEQKGVDLLVGFLEESPKNDYLFVVLGAGDKFYQEKLKKLEKERENIRVIIGFDETLAHKIYAASDFFVMPSRFEPCGLGQMIAMKYGTIPIVRGTGGLKDSVVDIEQGGYGILFGEYNKDEFKRALERSLRIYDNKAFFNELRERVMELDFSWDRSAREYLSLYKRLVGL